MLTYAEQIQNALKNRYRYSGYFLYWYKSTNTDTYMLVPSVPTKNTSKELLAHEYARTACGKAKLQVTYADVC